jgi:hypothetical protein
MQEIFNVRPFLLDACTATDLSDLFKPGSMPNDVVPEPRSILQVTAGLFGLALMRPHGLVRLIVDQRRRTLRRAKSSDTLA